MPTYDPKAWDSFLELLRLRLGVDIECDNFRMEVEDIYNFRLDHTSISGHELGVIEKLFDGIVRYSPLVEERKRYPGVYSDGQQFASAVENARQALSAEERGPE